MQRNRSNGASAPVAKDPNTCTVATGQMDCTTAAMRSTAAARPAASSELGARKRSKSTTSALAPVCHGTDGTWGRSVPDICHGLTVVETQQRALDAPGGLRPGQCEAPGPGWFLTGCRRLRLGLGSRAHRRAKRYKLLSLQLACNGSAALAKRELSAGLRKRYTDPVAKI